jgi:hypothetical protein
MDSDLCSALRLAANALCRFRTKFGVDLNFSNLCEIYAALQLGLPMPDRGNTKGFDLRGADGTHWPNRRLPLGKSGKLACDCIEENGSD